MKMLKRHLMTEHGMTPAGYRERWASRLIARWSRLSTLRHAAISR